MLKIVVFKCIISFSCTKQNKISLSSFSRIAAKYILLSLESPIFFLLSLWQFFHSRTEQRGGKWTDAKPWTVVKENFVFPLKYTSQISIFIT
jgi:hypothetical protein